jgi:hypothetical protein
MPNHSENFWLRYYPKTEITKWALDNKFINARINERIENGEYNFGLIRKPEYVNTNPYTDKFIFLLNIFPLLPAKLRSFILKHRYYRLFPKIPSLALLIIFKAVNHPKYDFNTLRTIKRYLYFAVKRFHIG